MTDITKRQKSHKVGSSGQWRPDAFDRVGGRDIGLGRPE